MWILRSLADVNGVRPPESGGLKGSDPL
jgi:hypothetical protein